MAFDQDALDSLRIDRNAAPAPAPDHRRWKWPLIALGALALLLGLYALLKDEVVAVETATVSAASGSAGAAVLNASGYVVARRQATVSAKVTGKVTEVLVEEGMSVKEGDLLARLDESTARPTLALSERQLDAARKNLAEVEVRMAEAERSARRMQQLRADKLVSEAQLDQAQSELAALTARLEAMRGEVKVAESTVRVRAQELDDLLVRAPFDGVVVSKDAQPGEMVSPISAGGGFTRTGIATIVDMSSREIEVDVNEAFINRVKAKQKTQAVLDAYPDWMIASHVINIVPTADRQKATVRVRIGFDELDPRILPDMGVKVTFLDDQPANAANQNAVRVPTTALVREGEAAYVWRVTDGAVQRVAVRAGAEHNSEVDVLSGVNAGDVVVTTPSAELRDGAAIKRAE